MSHFLIIFERRGLEQPVIEEYEDPSEAQARLFEVERDLQRDPDRGVVLLFGDSTEALRRTHGSYFKKIEELLETVEG